jgi:glycosyltransferase involved in cell wall biosynthesis
MQPLVSIIVPCYNYGHYLPETLQQLAKQQYSHWECIIVDDGSMDNTHTVSETFVLQDERFKYVYQTNMGLSAARNTGIAHANGKYLQFLDADDLIHTNKVAQQVAYLENHPDVDIVYGNSLFFEDAQLNVFLTSRVGDNGNAQRMKASGKGFDMITRFTYNNFLEVSSPLITKTLIDKVGLFDTSYTSYEDWQFWFRCSIKDVSFHFMPEEGTETYIRLGHASMMSNKNKMIINGIKIRKYMMSRLPFSLKGYNLYRLAKLYAHLITLSL